MTVFDDNLQGSCAIVFIIFTPICLIATGLRFVASRVALGKIGLEDWLALAALSFYLVWIVASSFALNYLGGKDVTQMELSDISNALRLIWASSIFFAPNQLFAKLSILCLYRRIFGINSTYAKWIKGLAIFHVLWAIETVLVCIFECRPIYKYWDPMYLGGYCINIGAYLAANETMNSLGDFVIAGLAVVMLRELKTTTLTKLRLAVVFAVGGLAGIIGFIKIALAFNVSVHNQIRMGLWATLQMAFSIVCCCVIAYGPLFAKANIANRLTARFSSYGSKSRQGPETSRVDRGAALSGGYVDLEGQGSFKTEIGTALSHNGTSTDSGDRCFFYENSDTGHLTRTVQVHQTVEPSK